MDPFDFEELEKMARNVVAEFEPDSEELDAIAQRWQVLFGYSHDDAVDAIERHRGNLSRSRVSDQLWDLVRSDYEPRGYDQEAYEHELELERGTKKQHAVSIGKVAKRKTLDVRGRYLVKLTDKLAPETIKSLADLGTEPEIVQGHGDEGNARFCLIDGTAKYALMNAGIWPSFKSTIVRIPQPAAKDLSPESAYPTLGLDTTLPQHRPSDLSGPFLPAQNQYPVWYFFYGTLAEPDRLVSLLSLSEEPGFSPAVIKGGVLKTWAGKYRALVDGHSAAEVHGMAYLVSSKEHEDALRTYETDNYEVVRCALEMDGQKIPGCTFRFVGDLGE